jgi:hypothetical protein
LSKLACNKNIELVLITKNEILICLLIKKYIMLIKICKNHMASKFSSLESLCCRSCAAQDVDFWLHGEDGGVLKSWGISPVATKGGAILSHGHQWRLDDLKVHFRKPPCSMLIHFLLSFQSSLSDSSWYSMVFIPHSWFGDVETDTLTGHLFGCNKTWDYLSPSPCGSATKSLRSMIFSARYFVCMNDSLMFVIVRTTCKTCFFLIEMLEWWII